jgi:hypothetical protein
MTDDIRPIEYCPRCECDVVTRTDGRCQWCLKLLVSHSVQQHRGRVANGLADRRLRRRPDGLCSACGVAAARRERARCGRCERLGIPSRIIGEAIPAAPCERAYTPSHGTAA